YPRLRLRMGVHSGPVDQIKDVNDRLNVAGAGINLAQRVMDCGDAGHILISKRVADDLAQDSLWQPLLHEVGQIEVKHGVKLGIANLYTEELGNPQTPKKLSHLQPQTKFTPSDHALNVPEKSIAFLPSRARLPKPSPINSRQSFRQQRKRSSSSHPQPTLLRMIAIFGARSC